MMEYRVKNALLCDIMWNSDGKHKRKSKVDIIIDEIKSSNSFSDVQILKIKKKLIDSFLVQYNRKWSKVARTKRVFMHKYADFLQAEFTVIFEQNHENNVTRQDASDESLSLSTVSRKGRPRLSFEEGSTKTKRRRVSEIAGNHSSGEILKALELVNQPRGCDTSTDAISENENRNRVLLCTWI